MVKVRESLRTKKSEFFFKNTLRHPKQIVKLKGVKVFVHSLTATFLHVITINSGLVLIKKKQFLCMCLYAYIFNVFFFLEHFFRKWEREGKIQDSSSCLFMFGSFFALLPRLKKSLLFLDYTRILVCWKILMVKNRL